jgi:hypothetical protein
MPKRQQLLDQLQGDHQLGVLLVAQLGGVPNELQFMIETAVYDEAAQGLRPRENYIVRALGVREQRVALGVFSHLALITPTADQPHGHPVLLHHNAPRAVVQFSGTPRDVHECLLDLTQMYLATLDGWRHLGDIRDELNNTMPLTRLLSGGVGVLGTFPLPLARQIAKVLEHHGMTVSIAQDAAFTATDDHGRSKLAHALVIDDSFVIALDFSVEVLGKA